MGRGEGIGTFNFLDVLQLLYGFFILVRSIVFIMLASCFYLRTGLYFIIVRMDIQTANRHHNNMHAFLLWLKRCV